MQVGEAVAPPGLFGKLKNECPFDHDLTDPPKVKKNLLIGKGSTLGSNMKHGKSTNLYDPYKPSSPLQKSIIPQKRNGHPFFKNNANKGRCIEIDFEDDKVRHYPCSCSAHHLIPAQESLKDHDILRYMCKKGGGKKHNHSYAGGIVWTDVGYDTNGSENGVYLPGSYAVGGGRGGMRVWYSIDEDPEKENDFVEVDKLPSDIEYNEYLLAGDRGKISEENPCWNYVAQAVKLAPGQFHDRHIYYSEQVVQKALTALFEKYKFYDVTLGNENCSKCKKKKKQIKEKGLPAPYGIVKQLEALSAKLRIYLSAKRGFWRKNIYTSEWGNEYMKSVSKGGKKKKAAELYE